MNEAPAAAAPGMPAATPPSSRRSGIIAALVERVGIAPPLLLLALLAPLPTAGGASIAGLPSLCVFRNATGLPCLGCGITRALVCLGHGHVAEAITFHPLSPFVFALLAAVTLDRIVALVRPHRRTVLPPRLVTLLGWTGLMALILVWVARLTGLLPTPP